MQERLNVVGNTSNLIGNVSECIATDGTKQFADSMLGEAVYSTLVYLNNTYLDLTNFNSSYLLANILLTQSALV